MQNKEKIIKLIIALLGILLFVFLFSRVAKHGSMTLDEYAKQNPELNPHQTTEIANQTTKKDSSPDSDGLCETFQADNDSLTTDLINGALTVSGSDQKTASSLAGVSLNGNLMEDERQTYEDCFYYEPLSERLKRYITGTSYPSEADIPEDMPITYEDLRYLHILHYDFNGDPTEGELICNAAIAQDLVEIFYELYTNEYQLEKVLLIDEYGGDDTTSMEDNNTSCFNFRNVENSTSLSKHALGCAIDINPYYNPYVTYNADGSQRVSPAADFDYSDRSANFPYKIDENDLCYKLFKAHGFVWGGNWNSLKDYQHFQKVIK